jgi:hypothetical protein
MIIEISSVLLAGFVLIQSFPQSWQRTPLWLQVPP